MSENNLTFQRDTGSKIISEEEEELNDFYNQMQITPNPSISHLDDPLFEYYRNSEQFQVSERNYLTPFKVKNILAGCLDDKNTSKENLEMIIDEDEKPFECSNVIKVINNATSPSSSFNQQKVQGEIASSCFLSFQQENDVTNDLFSTEKFDHLEIQDNSVFQQKLNYTIDIEDFMLNCTPNPFSIQAQKRAEKIFINKRIGEIKKQQSITKKLFNMYHQKNSESQSMISPYNNNSINKKESKNKDQFLKKGSLNYESMQPEKQRQILNKPHPTILKTKSQQSQLNIKNEENSNNNSQHSQIQNSRQNILKMSNVPCKCRKSQCLKLYCECFSRGEICGQSCICLDCRNSTQHLEQRNTAIKQIEVKNPSAFIINGNSLSTSSKISEKQQMNILQDSHIQNEIKKGCNCKKSKCKKKYCECYMAGKQCSLFCQCIDCTNNIPHTHSHSSLCQSLLSEEHTNQEMMSFVQAANQSSQSQVINFKKDQSLINLLKDFNKMNDQQIDREKNQQKKLMQTFNQINQKENNNRQDVQYNQSIQNNMQYSKFKKDYQYDDNDYQLSTTIINGKILTNKQKKIQLKNDQKAIYKNQN